jgi:nucleoside 2-deoxyribosyltransferase
MKIYFAGSIKGGREKREEYEQLIRFLNEFGCVLTEHLGKEDWTIQNEEKYSDNEEEHVYIRDVKWIDECDVVVAEVSIPSLGVGYEIGYAESKNKKVICLYDINADKNLSFMLSGNKKNIIIKYTDLDNAKSELRKYLKK